MGKPVADEAVASQEGNDVVIQERIAGLCDDYRVLYPQVTGLIETASMIVADAGKYDQKTARETFESKLIKCILAIEYPPMLFMKLAFHLCVNACMTLAYENWPIHFSCFLQKCVVERTVMSRQAAITYIRSTIDRNPSEMKWDVLEEHRFSCHPLLICKTDSE